MASCNSSLKHKLFPVDKKDYGKRNYQTHALEIYKSYVDQAENTNRLRRWVHPLFVSIHLLLIGGIGFIIENDLLTRLPVSALIFGLILLFTAPICLNIVWWRLIKNYQKFYSIKLKTIRAMEKKLPLAPYRFERKIAGSRQLKDGSPRYIEEIIPWAEKLLVYAIVGIYIGLLALLL